MHIRCSLLLLAFPLSAPAAAQALTNQDDCASSGVDVRVGDGMWDYDTSGATTGAQGQSEQACFSFGTSGIDNDIWFTWTASSDGLATLETCNSNGTHGDSKIAVWPAVPACPTPGTILACNDDACGLLSTVIFPVTAGSSYIVQLGSFPTAGGGTGLVEVATNPPAPIDIVAHYRLDETSGTTCNDASGNGNDGTFLGGYTLAQTGARPGTGRSVRFDGTSGRVEIPASPSLDALTSELSVAAWVNADALAGIMRLFGNTGPNGSWSYAIAPFGIRFTTHGIMDYNRGVVVTAGTWYHVACVFDAFADVTFYLDGVRLGTGLGTLPANPPDPTYVIGTFNGAIEFMNGRLDELQVYSGVLDDDAVRFLFDNPGQVFTPPAPIGTSYCSPAAANSTGQSGVIAAVGSPLLAFNDLELNASQMPPGQFGFFLAGRTEGFFNPPGSTGFICLTGDIGRYNQVANIFQGPTGMLDVDLTNLPTNTPGSQMVQPGETIRFQAWYRDVPSTNNFTDGVRITFQ